jgi:4-aminobutyrate aminotransferase|eukprot:COSAG06_NODE_702_length_12942_cov_22.841482_10_plen_445_part_00
MSGMKIAAAAAARRRCSGARTMATAAAAEPRMFPGIKRMSDLVVERGEGSTVWTADGTPFLDMTSGIGVLSTGHCHPKVVTAVQEQATKISHAQQSCFYSSVALELADELLARAPGMDSVFYANSGAEAVENALRVARQATDRDNVICFMGGYHGRTAQTLAITTSGTSYRGKRPGPMPGGTVVAPYPYEYAGVSQEAAMAGLHQLMAGAVNPQEVAALIIEPVQGEGGYIVPPPGYIAGLRKFCDEHGILMIADEVQSGMGRTGKVWGLDWEEGVKADVIVTAKGMASGYPISAVLTTAEHAACQVDSPNSFGGTYGGNAVACAAALATLRVMEEEGLVENCAARGEQLRAGLHAVSEKFPGVIGDIRGRGLMVGVEFDPAMAVGEYAGVAGRVSQASLSRGMLLLTMGTRQCVRFIPPLVVTESEIDTSLQIFEEAVAEAIA